MMSTVNTGTLLRTFALYSISLATFAQSAHKLVHRFQFGGTAAESVTVVDSNLAYSDERGYGFEPGPPITGKDGAVTSEGTFFFSVAVPEGNYRVTVQLGSETDAAVDVVKAELRRLMVEKTTTRAGAVVTRVFVVNVRRPQIPGDGSVHFKEREFTSEAWAWDDKLTLEFGGSKPVLRSLTVEPISVPTLFIAGDSTSTDQAREPYNSWGQMITAFFGPELAVANHGESGESAASFVSENRWAKLMSSLKAGDTVLIQFGHNDQKDKRPGAGAFTTYKSTLARFVRDVKARNAAPVLVTPMHRRNFNSSGKIENTLADYPAAVRQLAAEEQVALIDLNTMSGKLYEAFGPAGSSVLFAGEDKTHHSDFGSYELAKCVAAGLKQCGLPIAKYVRPDVFRFDPAHPDSYQSFDIPPDPERTTAKPYGN